MLKDILPAGVTVVYSEVDQIWTWVVGSGGVRIFALNEGGAFEQEGFEMDNPPTHINEMLHYCRQKAKEMQLEEA